MREASGRERRWNDEDEREAARWLGRDGAAPAEGPPLPTDRREAVLARIRATPPGFVRTYGDVSPGAPRFAGTVLHGDHDPDLPWWRIVRADGSVATHPPARQRKLLEAEGVPFRGDKVDMRAARVP